MTAVSLFSGIGGFDEGFRRAGIATTHQVEIDPQCRRVLERHFPEARRHEDVRFVGRELGPADVVCGGFPCQDLSVAGRRAGFAGDRSSLWFEFRRVVEELRPTFVVIENVPGLLSSNEGRDMGTLLGGLEDIGYGWAYRVLDSQYFGVAQRRRRVFIVGHSDPRRAAEILFEPESLRRDSPPSRETGKDVAFALRREPSHSGDKGDGGINCTLVSRCLMGRLNDSLDPTMQTYVAGTLAASGAGSSRPAGNCNETDMVVPVAFHTSGYGGQVGDVAQPLQASDALLSNQVSGVLQSGVRRLMPVECERLQGFPDGWTDGFADSVRYRMLGNAISVPVAEWIGKRLIEFESQQIPAGNSSLASWSPEEALGKVQTSEL